MALRRYSSKYAPLVVAALLPGCTLLFAPPPARDGAAGPDAGLGADAAPSDGAAADAEPQGCAERYTVTAFADFDTAIALCGDARHVVSIADAAENSLVTELRLAAGADVFIGYHDPDGDGAFEWTSGEPVTYENWGAESEGDCAELLADGTWRKLSCVAARPAVCECNE